MADKKGTTEEESKKTNEELKKATGELAAEKTDKYDIIVNAYHVISFCQYDTILKINCMAIRAQNFF